MIILSVTKKQRLHPLSRRYIFGKTTEGVQIDPLPSLPPPVLEVLKKKKWQRALLSTLKLFQMNMMNLINNNFPLINA